MKDFELWLGFKGCCLVSVTAERYTLSVNDISFWIGTTLVFHVMLDQVYEVEEVVMRRGKLTYEHIYKRGEKNE